MELLCVCAIAFWVCCPPSRGYLEPASSEIESFCVSYYVLIKLRWISVIFRWRRTLGMLLFVLRCHQQQHVLLPQSSDLNVQEQGAVNEIEEMYSSSSQGGTHLMSHLQVLTNQHEHDFFDCVVEVDPCNILGDVPRGIYSNQRCARGSAGCFEN